MKKSHSEGTPPIHQPRVCYPLYFLFKAVRQTRCAIGVTRSNSGRNPPPTRPTDLLGPPSPEKDAAAYLNRQSTLKNWLLPQQDLRVQVYVCQFHAIHMPVFVSRGFPEWGENKTLTQVCSSTLYPFYLTLPPTFLEGNCESANAILFNTL